MNRSFSSLLLFSCLVSCAGSAEAAPYVPQADEEVIERVTTSGNASHAETRELRAELSRDPKNLKVALELARINIEIAKRESDNRYFGFAEAALKGWTDAKEIPEDVLRTRAGIRQSLHNFNGAVSDLRLALAQNPRDYQAWLNLAAIQLVQGDFAGSKESCERVVPASVVLGATCAAAVTSMTGDADKAAVVLQRMLAVSSNQGASVQLWILGLLAEAEERLALIEPARRHYAAAIAMGEPDAFLLTAYADFLLARNEARAVIELLKNVPRSEVTIVRQALAYKKLGMRAELEEIRADLAARFAVSGSAGDGVHLREEAMFLLHLQGDAAKAADVALRNWNIQREFADLKILWESGTAAGRKDVLTIARDWIAANRFSDARLRTSDNGGT